MLTSEAVDRFLASCRSRNLAPKTVSFYRWALEPFAQAYPGELPQSVEELERYLGRFRGAAETLKDRQRALRRFYRWLASRYGLANPAQALERPAAKPILPKTLSRAQVEALLGQPLSRRDRAILTVLLDTGIRLGECHSLRREDLRGQTILVTGKRGVREVPISPQAQRALLGVELPWAGPKGPLTLSGLQQAVAKAMRRAGLERGGPHTLRHTFARHYILNGGDAFSLQRILGHRSIECTMIYVYMDTRDMCAQHAKYSLIANLA